MKGTTKQTIGTMVGTMGVLTVYNSFELHSVGPFWLGGSVLIAGVLLAVLGWNLISRGRGDVALADQQHNEAEVAKHREFMAGRGPQDQGQEGERAAAETESSLEEPPETR
ncbi:hypothetical protein RF644_17815 [Kocuria sp. CPCC 205258]|uniref:hypothetical protein n=1 Tax=Kocuria sp. CPCC 205258 TaxID=3073552 RepID=UPI0034D47531